LSPGSASKCLIFVTRIVDLLLTEPSYAAGTRLTQDHRPAALAMYRARWSAGSDWGAFLAGFVDLRQVDLVVPLSGTTARQPPKGRSIDSMLSIVQTRGCE